MRITKEYDESSGGWYYADPKGRRVSPTYEHEGVLDKWAELHGAFATFVVFKRNLESGAEEYVGHYGDYETADRRSAAEKREEDATRTFIGIREETWMQIDEVP
jgi:hypothetical protein